MVHTAQHWKRVLCPVIRKGSWDDIEELKLFQLVEKYGQSWKNIASEIGTRTGKPVIHHTASYSRVIFLKLATY